MGVQFEEETRCFGQTFVLEFVHAGTKEEIPTSAAMSGEVVDGNMNAFESEGPLSSWSFQPTNERRRAYNGRGYAVLPGVDIRCHAC
jgi:hypothetical protein